jgi:glycosyltransferase involved in cell wall biosynthesis
LTEIVLTRLSPIVYDPKVSKIVKSLKKRYSILVLGWNRENVPKNVIDNYMTNLKLLNIRAPRGKSIIHSPKMLFGFACYWTWLFFQLVKSNPIIIHSCDLDTVIPCYLYKLLFRKKLVFDVFDRYAMAFVPSKCKVYYSIVNYLEEFFSKRADVLITISEKVLCTFGKKPEHCVVIMNCPEDHAIEKGEPQENQPMRIVYTGAILRKSRGLENVIAAMKDLTGVEFVIAGWYLEKDKDFVNQILEIPSVKFRGHLEPDDTLALEATSDVMIALYDPELWNNITLSNKLFEAMMCGVPLITNVSSEVVSEVGSGIIVQYNDVQQIKEAIVALRDNLSLRQSIGLNGRKAFLEKYNWPIMEKELFKIYEDLQKK